MSGLFIGHPKSVWRYVAIRRVGDILSASAVIATAAFGIWAGAAILLTQVWVAAITDLSFFAALSDKERGK